MSAVLYLLEEGRSFKKEMFVLKGGAIAKMFLVMDTSFENVEALLFEVLGIVKKLCLFFEQDQLLVGNPRTLEGRYTELQDRIRDYLCKRRLQPPTLEMIKNFVLEAMFEVHFGKYIECKDCCVLVRGLLVEVVTQAIQNSICEERERYEYRGRIMNMERITGILGAHFVSALCEVDAKKKKRPSLTSAFGEDGMDVVTKAFHTMEQKLTMTLICDYFWNVKGWRFGYLTRLLAYSMESYYKLGSNDAPVVAQWTQTTLANFPRDFQRLKRYIETTAEFVLLVTFFSEALKKALFLLSELDENFKPSEEEVRLQPCVLRHVEENADCSGVLQKNLIQTPEIVCFTLTNVKEYAALYKDLKKFLEKYSDAFNSGAMKDLGKMRDVDDQIREVWLPRIAEVLDMDFKDFRCGFSAKCCDYSFFLLTWRLLTTPNYPGKAFRVVRTSFALATPPVCVQLLCASLRDVYGDLSVMSDIHGSSESWFKVASLHNVPSFASFCRVAEHDNIPDAFDIAGRVWRGLPEAMDARKWAACLGAPFV